MKLDVSVSVPKKELEIEMDPERLAHLDDWIFRNIGPDFADKGFESPYFSKFKGQYDNQGFRIKQGVLTPGSVSLAEDKSKLSSPPAHDPAQP